MARSPVPIDSPGDLRRVLHADFEASYGWVDLLERPVDGAGPELSLRPFQILTVRLHRV